MDGCVSLSRGKVCKDYMERIMNEEDDWDHYLEGNAVDGSADCVCGEDVVQALSKMTAGKGSGSSDVSLELIAASWGVGVHQMI